MALTSNQLAAVTNGNVIESNGNKIGGVGQIYLDDQTGEPEWVTVKTGLFGTSESFVPLSAASVSGSDIVVTYDKDTIKDAPRIDADGELTPEEEQSLYAYYGLGGTRTENVRSAENAGTDRDATVGRDTSGPTTDDAMTLSEERLRVGTQTREAGRARLRKYVVTEKVVDVSREEVPVDEDRDRR